MAWYIECRSNAEHEPIESNPTGHEKSQLIVAGFVAATLDIPVSLFIHSDISGERGSLLIAKRLTGDF